MATTLEQVCEYLDRDGWRYLVDADAQRVHCRERTSQHRHELEVRVDEDGSCLHFRIPRVTGLGNSPHAALLLERILELHYQIKIGRFGLDATDGEIDCEVILPLEDAPLTHRQFARCVSALVLLVDQQKPRFEHLLATGEDPARQTDEQLDAFLDKLAATLGLTRDELRETLGDVVPEEGGDDR